MGELDLEEIANRYIRYYKDSLNSIKEELGTKGAYGAGNSFYPICYRKEISWIVSLLKENEHDILDFEKKIHDLDEEFNKYIDKNRVEYLDHLFADFKKLLKKYNPRAILIDGYEFEHITSARTYIEILTSELENHFDIEEHIDRIGGLDELLQDKIFESIEAGTYSPMDLPFAPKDYWWLHLEEVYGKPESDLTDEDREAIEHYLDVNKL